MGRLDDVEGFLSPNAITSLRRAIDRGYKTAQEFMDPEPFVRIHREPVGGGPAELIFELKAIMVRFGVRESTTTGDGPITFASSSGQMHHEADKFDLRVGDIVQYQGRSSRVMAVNPPEFGVVISDLELDQ